jgi:hypothetical protein
MNKTEGIKTFLSIFADPDHCEICMLRRYDPVCTGLLAFVFDHFITLLGKSAWPSKQDLDFDRPCTAIEITITKHTQ